MQIDMTGVSKNEAWLLELPKSLTVKGSSFHGGKQKRILENLKD